MGLISFFGGAVNYIQILALVFFSIDFSKGIVTILDISYYIYRK